MLARKSRVEQVLAVLGTKTQESVAGGPIISSMEATEHVQLGLGLCDCDVQRRGMGGKGCLPWSSANGFV